MPTILGAIALFVLAAYIANWLKVLKADKKAIFTAASAAAKPTDFLAGLQVNDITEAAA